MKNLIINALLIIIFIGCSSTISPVENNTFFINQSTSTMFEVQLNNIEEIYALQFSLHASSNILLGKVERDFLTINKHWIVDSYNVNDSIMNVLIINMQGKCFPIGNGILIKIPFTIKTSNEIVSISLFNVIATNKNADCVSTVAYNLIGQIK